VDYLSYAAKRISYTHIVTNGSLLKGDLLEAVSESGVSEISVSIDGLDELHDQNRKEGAFNAALEAIKALKKRSCPLVTCSTTIGYWNASDLQKLSELMDSLSVSQRFMFYQDYPISSQKEGGGIENPASVDEIISFTRYYLKRHDDILLSFAPSFFKAKSEGKPFTPSILKGPCLLPSYFVNVLWQGEVFPCFGMRSTLYPGVGITGTVGEFNIRKYHGLLDILRSPEYEKMRKKLRGCQECFRFFASCYVRPRLSFPLKNFINYRVLKRT
jgi:MoaA/NifB/PqqE/SkfB family radical SAM enzyme